MAKRKRYGSVLEMTADTSLPDGTEGKTFLLGLIRKIESKRARREKKLHKVLHRLATGHHYAMHDMRMIALKALDLFGEEEFPRQLKPSQRN